MIMYHNSPAMKIKNVVLIKIKYNFKMNKEIYTYFKI